MSKKSIDKMIVIKFICKFIKGYIKELCGCNKITGIHEEKVNFDAVGVKVPGVLTVSDKIKQSPGILMIAGSGPTDRDWNNSKLPGKNGSGKLLARVLAKCGFVTFRYDKRGSGKIKSISSVSLDDYSAEQMAALDYLESSSYTSNSLYVMGHSEGALHAINLASKDSSNRIKGLILLSPPGRTMHDVLLSQIGSQLLNSMSKEQADREINLLDRALTSIAEGQPVLSDDASSLPGIRKFYQLLTKQTSIKFIEEMLSFDPVEKLTNLNIPVLIIVGEKDMQVDVNLDAKALYTKAKAAGYSDIELNIVPNADHVCKLENISKEKLTPIHGLLYNCPGRILEPSIAPTIVDWIDRR